MQVGGELGFEGRGPPVLETQCESRCLQAFLEGPVFGDRFRRRHLALVLYAVADQGKVDPVSVSAAELRDAVVITGGPKLARCSSGCCEFLVASVEFVAEYNDLLLKSGDGARRLRDVRLRA